jgi:translocation and assembly module TamB
VVLVLVATTAVVTLVNRDGVHRYLIQKAQDEARTRLGVRVGLENFTLHLSTLSLDLYGVSVDGADPYPRPQLLRVDHVEIGARVISVPARKWYLTSVQIDHPVVWITVDKRGVSNIPQLKSSNNGSGTSIFDLAIRHAVINRGEVYFNSRPSALAADVHDVNFRTAFSTLLARYSGQLAYTNAHLQYGDMQPIVHSLAFNFDATASTFHLTRATLSCGHSQLLLSATLKNYGAPDVQAQYDATVDGDQIGQILNNSSIPGGLLRASGTLRYQKTANRSFLQSLMVDGDLMSTKLDVKTSSARGEIGNLAAHYSLFNGDATLRDLRARVLGGALTAQGTMKNVDGDSHSNVSAALHGVSMALMRQAFLRPGAQPAVTVTGTLDATASASWDKTLDDLMAHVDATANGKVVRSSGTPNPAAPAVTIPVESVIHATYTGNNKQFALENTYLHTTQSNVTMNGTVGRRSSLAVELKANDLREASEIADLFRAAQPGEPLRPLDLAGEASFAGEIQGSTSAPHLTGALSAVNVHFNGTDWKSFHTDVDLSPSHAGLQHAELDSVSQGHVSLNAGADLDNWLFTNESILQVQLSASRVNVTDIAKLAGRQIPVTGMLNASLTLHGSELHPQGSGEVSSTGVTAYDEPIQSVKLNFSGNGDEMRAKLSARLAAGGLEGNATVQPQQKAYTAQLTTSGIELSKLHAVETRGLNMKGVLAVHANGQGTFDNPQIDADLQIPTLTVEDQTISAIKLHASLADYIAHAALTSSVMGAAIQAKATVDLSGDYLADASLDTNAFPLQPLLIAYAPDEAASVSGQTELHATLHGPLKNRNLLEAHATIPLLKFGYSNTIQLAAAAPIQVDYKNGIVDLQPASIRGTDTDLNLQASVPIEGEAPASLLAQGTVNLALLQLLNPDLRSSGELKLNINSHGPLNGRNMGGEIQIVDANLSSAEMPVGLQHGNGVLTLSADRLNIDKLQGMMGGGTVTAQGGIAYRPRLQFNLGVAAQGVRLLYPQGVRETVDTTLRLTGAFSNATLGGTVNISDLSFTPGFDLTDFIQQFSGGVVAPPQRGFAQNLALNIAVHSTSNVNLVSRTLSVGGSANLQVRGTAAQPVILGRMNLNGGDIILNGSRFVLTGGTVQFVNPSETEPVVNLMLTTSIQQYNIHLRFNGPVNQLRTDYSSDPALPAADIINLLAFGETTEASANNPMTTNQQAESIVARKCRAR